MQTLGLICIATGKSAWASAGKNMSTAFLGNGWSPSAGPPTSMMCILPPAAVRAAMQSTVDVRWLPGSLKLAKHAAWPSMG